MYLSGLELYGFKSFLKKTRLTFSPGVMGIVGPNGCGKSNLVDAVRWVLGEQRTSVLRSDKMENVIFAGTAKHKPMQFAEVTLVIENSHGILPAEYTEVAITRKLHRTGESEYLINRRPCRLKDIRSLFADTGLGPDSYSIIELKMVENILSTRTDERRRLFEEAAGVTLYKQRLRQAQLRLNATRADMVRLEDLLQEVTGRRNSLKRQVARTKRFRFLREALRVKELSAASREVEEIRAKMVPLDEKIQQDKKRRDQFAVSLERGEEELAAMRGKLGAVEETLTSLRGTREELELRSQKSQREMVMLEERLRSGVERREERDTEEQELISRRGEIAKAIEALDGERNDAKSRDQQIRARLEAFDVTWQEYEERFREVKRLRDQREQVRREAEHRDVRIESECSQLETRLEQVGSRLVQLQMDDHEAGPAPDFQTAETAVEEAKTRLSALEGRIESGRDQRDELREQRSQAEKELAASGRDLEAAKRRVKLFESIVSGGEGRPKAVKALLSSGLKGIVGRLGDAVVVDECDKIAVAAALEDVLSAVVTENNGDLQSAAAFLQKEDRGRGMLAVALDAGNSPEVSLAEREGVVGCLGERVRAKGRASGTIDRFLQRTWLVEDLDVLLNLAEVAAAEGQTLVTPDGCRWTPDGILAVGHTDASDLGAADLLEQAQEELESVEERIENFREEVDSLQNREKEAGRTLDATVQQRNEERQQLDQARRELSKIQADLREHEALERKRAEELASLNEEKAKLDARLEALEEEAEEAEMALDSAESAVEEVASDYETLEEEGRSLRSARDRLREQQVEASSALERLQGEVRRQGALLDEIGRRLERIKQERRDAAGALEDAEERLRHVQGEFAVISRDLETTTEQQKEIDQKYTAMRRQFNELDGGLSEKRNELAMLGDRLHVSEMEMQDLKHRLSSVRERILEAYEIDLMSYRQEELPLAVQDDNPYLEYPLGEIRDALKHIGPVNQMAVEEFEIIDTRWKQLTEQHLDLTEAIELLEKSIKEINTIARERFLATFTRVEGHFVSLFSRLFGGGEAALSLQEGDPLEAGIQIYASPKGKKPSTIDLLSGGEKAMTAIALLFALYLERPSPFCFLDEVDAPLDDVNVVRFNRLIREFTDRTQFLTVTHNKLTMERADRLYGVTQEEEGVSTLVAVEIGKNEQDAVRA